MAEYITRAGDRLDWIALDQYGSVTSEGVQSIIYANPDFDFSNAVLEQGITLEVPNTLAVPQFSEVEWRQTGTSSVNWEYTDHNTGAIGTLSDAVRWAIIVRCICPRGDVWFKPELGSTLYTLLSENIGIPVAEAICIRAVQPDLGFYSASFTVSRNLDVLTINADGDVFSIDLPISPEFTFEFVNLRVDDRPLRVGTRPLRTI